MLQPSHEQQHCHFAIELVDGRADTTPAAPAAIARGAVTLDRPEAHSTGTDTARKFSQAAARGLFQSIPAFQHEPGCCWFLLQFG